jgi:F1F0 ATPase subunit 2
MNIDLLGAALALVGGMILGVAYFGALWSVVRSLPDARQPGLRLAGTTTARLAVAMLAFYLALQAGLANLVACLLGFAAARVAVLGWVTRRTGTAGG